METNRKRTFEVLSGIELVAMILIVGCGRMPADELRGSFANEVEDEDSTQLRNSRPSSSQQLSSTGKATFENCNGKEKTLKQAVIDAATMAESGLALLKNDDYIEDEDLLGPGHTPIYVRWFGNYSRANQNVVYTKMNRILAALERNTFHFECGGCEEPRMVAEVFDHQRYRVRICPPFWKLKRNGMNSKAGAILHETSHFIAVARTEDYAYSIPDCEKLAKRKSWQAILNANSYAHFCADAHATIKPKEGCSSGANTSQGGLGVLLSVILLILARGRRLGSARLAAKGQNT